MSAIGNAILRWRDYRGIPLNSDERPTTAELADFVEREKVHGQGGAAPSPQKQVQRPHGQHREQNNADA